MKTYLPIIVKYSPIRKLALIPFEKSPDKIYRGFELQFIEGEPYGVGYRVLAYRNDNYIDVYDDLTLKFLENEQFNVVENGLHKHIKTKICNVRMYKEDHNQVVSFEFIDIQDRKILVHIEEKSKKSSRAMNLLAPIGVGSKSPDYLPLFFMYNFDFIRKNKTIISCTIDGKNIKIDNFPISMNGQTRLYARYSNECELLEFANTSVTELREVELNENNTYREGNVEYLFVDKDVLKKIIVYFDKQNIEIDFEAGLSLSQSCVGEFVVTPGEQMGRIRGNYMVRCGDEITIFKMSPRYGWTSKPNSFVTRIILSKSSLFCSWSKKYTYEAFVDLSVGKVEASWKNGNLK